jgi:hypothetical protein
VKTDSVIGRLTSGLYGQPTPILKVRFAMLTDANNTRYDNKRTGSSVSALFSLKFV